MLPAFIAPHTGNTRIKAAPLSRGARKCGENRYGVD